MMDQIADCIQNNPRWKIVSLSYGPDEPVDEDSEPDRFTAEIDLLAYEHDITFLIAVGNLDEHQRQTSLAARPRPCQGARRRRQRDRRGRVRRARTVRPAAATTAAGAPVGPACASLRSA